MNATPTRIALSKLLSQRERLLVSSLAETVAPRLGIGGRRLFWTSQGAARWGGGYVRPCGHSAIWP